MSLPQQQIERIADLLRKRNKIQAIKELREWEGLSLRDAKDSIDIWEAAIQSGKQFVPPKSVTPERTKQIFPADYYPDVMEALRANRKIDAIKLYRQHTGQGLKEAKDAVEQVPPYLLNQVPAHLLNQVLQTPQYEFKQPQSPQAQTFDIKPPKVTQQIQPPQYQHRKHEISHQPLEARPRSIHRRGSAGPLTEREKRLGRGCMLMLICCSGMLGSVVSLAWNLRNFAEWIL